MVTWSVSLRGALLSTLVCVFALASACGGDTTASDDDDDRPEGGQGPGEAGGGGRTGGSGGTAGDGSGGTGGDGTGGSSGGKGGTAGTGGTDDCGNGSVDSDEECDDENASEGDGCDASCRREDGWQCDMLEPTGCEETCGDGLVVGAEAVGTGCDDGNTEADDGCGDDCRVEPGASCSGEPSVCALGCGDGDLGATEECDDGNDQSGDGCSSVCREESGWNCPDPGEPCVSTAQCGDRELGGPEVCDDGNEVDDDGCAGDCRSVDPGYYCPAPGMPCRERCGDGDVTGDEECEDGNATSGDGCSSTCRIEAGASCNGSACVFAVCGNGTVEAGEACDLGADNGRYTGDGNGCGATCTLEPSCRSGGVTGACTTACGDGNVDSGEECDDGNGTPGDGCSDDCLNEDGFSCTEETLPLTVPCSTNSSTQCIVLPVVHRDFDGHHLSNGHPDFMYFGATAANGRTTGVIDTRTACIPNSAGTKLTPVSGICPANDQAGPCPGIAGTALNAEGKPALGIDTCPCVFTDWDQTGVLTGITGSTVCTVEGAGTTRERIDTTVKVVQNAESFAQWFTDSSFSTKVTGTIELGPSGNAFRFSSGAPGAAPGTAGRTIQDDIHSACLGAGSTLSSGFFPLDGLTGVGSTQLCNIWPYMLYSGATAATCRAGAGYAVLSQWDPLAAWDACPSPGTGGSVPSSSGTGTPLQGVLHNYYFTTEARYLYRYTAPVTISYSGDDDAWVFVNGIRAIDLGGTHERLTSSVELNATFNLVAGQTYEIAIFRTDRHPRDSNYELVMPASTAVRSVCSGICGDGVKTATEECDDGGANEDGLYGGCDATCRLGAFCGDGVRNGPEECDLGLDNGSGDCDVACRSI